MWVREFVSSLAKLQSWTVAGLPNTSTGEFVNGTTFRASHDSRKHPLRYYHRNTLEPCQPGPVLRPGARIDSTPLHGNTPSSLSWAHYFAVAYLVCMWTFMLITPEEQTVEPFQARLDIWVVGARIMRFMFWFKTRLGKNCHLKMFRRGGKMETLQISGWPTETKSHKFRVVNRPVENSQET